MRWVPGTEDKQFNVWFENDFRYIGKDGEIKRKLLCVLITILLRNLKSIQKIIQGERKHKMRKGRNC